MHKEKRAELEWLWYCCECGCGANSALVSEYCPSCQKHRCTLCAMEEPPASKRVSTPAAPSSKSKERRQKPPKNRATRTGVTPETPNDVATNRINAKSQSPPVGEAQQRACRRSLSGTPPSSRAGRASSFPQIGNLANQGGSGSIPTSDHLSDSPNESLDSSASANSLSTEPPHAAPVARPVTGFHEPTSLHVHPEALWSNLHHQPSDPHLSEYNYEALLLDEVCQDLPPLSYTTTEETLRNTSPSFSLDSYQGTPIPQPNPPDSYPLSYPNGNNPISTPSPSDAFNPNFEPGSYLYCTKPTSDEIGFHETLQMTGSSIVDYPNVPQPQPLPGNLVTHPNSLRAPTDGALVGKLALVKQPKPETGMSSKPSDRCDLPSLSNKRKREPKTFGDERQPGCDGIRSYDGAADYEEKNLACPFYKLNPKQYMGCGERSIGNISALGQHIRQSHKLKPHSCAVCLGPFDSEASLRLHREGGYCYKTGGCTVNDLEQVPRKCKGRKDTWYWYWEQLFPLWTPPPSPYTDKFDVVGQFALSAIRDVMSEFGLQEPLKSELFHRMLTASDHWRKHPSAPLDYSQFSNHKPSDLTANRDYGLQH